MTFKDRFDKILKDNKLDVNDVVKMTGMSRHAYYRMMSNVSTKKYQEIENLFAICETQEQVVELAIGDKPLKLQHAKQFCKAEMFKVVNELRNEVREIKEEIKKIR